MDEIKGFSEDAYQVAEAVVLRDAMNLYLTHTAKAYPNHEDLDYKLTIQFLTLIYKKYQKIAATPCKVDESGRLVLRRDIRRDFDLN